MLSKPLIYTALIFQIIGIIWDFWHHTTNGGGLGEFFAKEHWPIFLGFVLLLVAVLQAWSKKKNQTLQ